ncbi:hypothetical protein [Dokdonia sp. PRO95]|uniref:hypothetical protein n=1 Tax=Dokdonia sp. PRO95 TaxID=1239415 RepID=UPI000550D74F|nr:hypothetical protein [Dokdonia sp. PRO95]
MNKIKLLLLVFLLFSFGANSQCWLSDLTAELTSGSVEFKALIKSNNEGINAYRILHSAGRSGLRTTPEALASLSTILSNTKAQNILGNEMNTILTKFAQTHSTSFYNRMAFKDHLNLLNSQINKYEGIPGFNKSIRDPLNNANTNVQDGFWHTLKDMEARNIPPSHIKKVDMQFDSAELPCTYCKFDLELNTNSPIKYLEYKSYQDASKISKNQFLNYLASIDNFDQLNYVFSSQKLSVTQAQDGLKLFLKNNEIDIIDNLNESLKLEITLSEASISLTTSQINYIANKITTIF